MSSSLSDEINQLNFQPIKYTDAKVEERPMFELPPILASVNTKDTQMDEISRLNFQPSTYTSDRVVRVQHIGCVDNFLLIFPQFVNPKYNIDYEWTNALLLYSRSWTSTVTGDCADCRDNHEEQERQMNRGEFLKKVKSEN